MGVLVYLDYRVFSGLFFRFTMRFEFLTEISDGGRGFFGAYTENCKNMMKDIKCVSPKTTFSKFKVKFQSQDSI